MNFLDQGIVFFEENNFLASVTSLKRFLYENNSDQENKLLAYSYLYKIFSLEKNVGPLRDEILEYASKLLEIGTFDLSLKILEELNLENLEREKGIIQFKLFECLKTMGNISRAKTLGLKLLEYYFRKRNTLRGLEFANNYEEIFGKQKTTSIYRFLYYGLIGDIEAITSIPLYDEITNDYFMEKLPPNIERNIDDLMDFLIPKEVSIDKSSNLMAMILKRKNDLITNYGFILEDCLDQKDGFVTDLYEYLVLNFTSVYPYLLLLKYSLGTKQKHLGLSVKAVLLVKREMFSGNSDLKKYTKQLVQKIDRLKKSTRNQLLEEDISKYLDGDLKSDRDEITPESYNKNSNDIFKDDFPILESKNDPNETINEIALIKAIELTNPEFFMNNYQDYLTCCIFLEFYKASYFVITRARELSPKEDELELIYLENEILFRQELYLEALSNIEICLSSIPLSYVEKEVFLNFKLRIFKRMGEGSGEFKVKNDLKELKKIMRNNLRSIS